MKSPIIIKLLSIAINLLSCMLAAVIFLSLHHWFGAGGTRAFIFWTILLAIGLGLSGRTILVLFRSLNWGLRFLLILLLSILISLGWSYLVFFFLGPLFNTFSIPVFYLWIVGCFVQLVFLDRSLSPQTEKIKIRELVFRLLALPLTLIVVMYTTVMLYSMNTLERFSKIGIDNYLISNDFTGTFRVVYGEWYGTEPVYEKGRRVNAEGKIDKSWVHFY